MTATGQGYSSSFFNRLDVQLRFTEVRQDGSAPEGERERLRALLITNSVVTDRLLDEQHFGAGVTGYFFYRDFPASDPEAFLARLGEFERVLRAESDLGIGEIEVRFAGQDCTQAAYQAREFALHAAKEEAEYLAALAGGRRGAILSLTGPSTPSSPRATSACYGGEQEWHPIPVQADLDDLKLIEREATVTVTFAVEERIEEAPAGSPMLAPISPLPTPGR